ncbi:MAG: DDE-type integrase/transposase/recombinase [Flavobacteriaceae bacterium]
MLPLDDLYIALKPIMPELPRSNLHRCLQRNGISRLSDLLAKEEKATYKKFKDYGLGYLHVDTAEIKIGKQKWYLFVAIDRATRFVHIEVYDNKRMSTAADFLEGTLEQYPFKITKILTDNGIEFCYNALIEEKKPKNKAHLFIAVYNGHDIEHRTTLVKHP